MSLQRHGESSGEPTWRRLTILYAGSIMPLDTQSNLLVRFYTLQYNAHRRQDKPCTPGRGNRAQSQRP
jgi:hypothetical protein